MDHHLKDSLGYLLYQSKTLVIGIFDCPRQHPCFRDTGPAANDILVFPRHAVYIKHDGKREILANQQIITLYNKGQAYRRQPLAPYGDYSVWVHFPRETLVSAMEQAGQTHRRMDSLPFNATHMLSNNSIFLQQRLLYRYLNSCRQPSALLVEDTAFQLLEQLLSINSPRHSRCKTRKTTAERHQDLAAHCRMLLTSRMDQRLTLADLADEIGTTPFHLSRVFKSQTGISIHKYLLQLRLRNAVDLLLEQPRRRLTDLAMDLGFATPSHFAQSFRHHFGMSPGRMSIQGLAAISNIA